MGGTGSHKAAGEARPIRRPRKALGHRGPAAACGRCIYKIKRRSINQNKSCRAAGGRAGPLSGPCCRWQQPRRRCMRDVRQRDAPATMLACITGLWACVAARLRGAARGRAAGVGARHARLRGWPEGPNSPLPCPPLFGVFRKQGRRNPPLRGWAQVAQRWHQAREAFGGLAIVGRKGGCPWRPRARCGAIACRSAPVAQLQFARVRRPAARRRIAFVDASGAACSGLDANIFARKHV